MTDLLRGKDCLRLEGSLDHETRLWLAELTSSVEAGELVVALGERRGEDEPVVYCERNGDWYCGRYVGTIAYKGRRLQIELRFGLDTLGSWLSMALGLRTTETAGELAPHEAFLPQLLARLWVRSLIKASRHGPPALRHDKKHEGVVIRGRLDVRSTVGQRTKGRPSVVSISRERSLNNPVSRTLVAAYAVLRRQLGVQTLEALMPPQARELVGMLTSVVPLSTAVPQPAELARVRLSPITEPYRPALRLSQAIAKHRGLFAESTPEGQATGVLLDMAELWELFLFSCLRIALPQSEIVHGTSDEEGQGHLLSNAQGARLGRLMPDMLLRTATQVIVADAKYKSLRPRSSRPQGVEREDLYQMSAYLSRWGQEGGTGLLLYPREEPEFPSLARQGPWNFHNGQQLHFLTVPREADEAVDFLSRTLEASSLGETTS
jgi:5-methylcytosine-specific restriction enzyme subunit McrC